MPIFSAAKNQLLRFLCFIALHKKKSVFLVTFLSAYFAWRFNKEKFRPEWWLTRFQERAMRELHKKMERSEHLNTRKKELQEVLTVISNSVKASKKTILTEIKGLFNIESLRMQLKEKSLTQAEKRDLWEKFKTEIIQFSITTLSVYRLFEFMNMLKDLLRHVLMEKFKKYRGLIEDCDDISDYIINEFYEQLFQKGLKNIALLIKKRLNENVTAQIPHNAEVSISDIFQMLNSVENDIIKIGSKLEQPNDNYRWSSCSNIGINTKGLHRGRTRVMFTDFNIVASEFSVDFDDDDSEFPAVEESRVLPLLFVDKRNLNIPKNQLDLVFIFLGDIDKHKFFKDQEFIERYIISADKNYRAEKYKSELGEIREEAEQEDSIDDDSKENEIELCDEAEGGEPCENHRAIEEARFKLSKLLKRLCMETVDIFESANFQIYLYHAIKYEFLRFKNRILLYFRKTNKGFDQKTLFAGLLNIFYRICTEEVLGEEATSNQNAFYEQRIKMSLASSSVGMNDQTLNAKADEELLLNIKTLKEIQFFKSMQISQDSLVKSIFYDHEEYRDLAGSEDEAGESQINELFEIFKQLRL